MLHIVERTGDHVTGALPVDVDLYSTPSLRAEVDRMIDEGCRHLTLDASRMLFIDSTGITALVSWYQRLAALRGSVAVRGLSDHHHSLLTRLGLDTVMTISGRPLHEVPPP
ncbi:STAS domain-containing protein [Streptomyces sp. NPDC001046]|uniref:STAS domain-containing protein n=1 Tax=unclassified Streptomyces TaxID=2593676 RepID=UPI0036C47AA9